MFKRLAVTAVMICFASGAFAATTTRKLEGGRSLVISAAIIDVASDSNKFILRGKADVKVSETVTVKVKTDSGVKDAYRKVITETSADKIILVLAATSGSSVTSSIQSAQLIGSPKIVQTAKDRDTGEFVSDVTATSDTADYQGDTQIASLKGNVRIIRTDKALFDGPAEMIGDEATMHLGKLDPEAVRYSISSSPGVSTITATPKSKEETKPKK
jgi:hypothetical protein